MPYDKVVDSQALDGALGADAIRGKTGTTQPMTLDQMPGAISGIQTGVALPELSNPGTSGDLMAGKEMIGSDGRAISGSFTLDAEIAQQNALIEQIREELTGKILGGASELPDGYSRCDYILFTGGQLVDTGLLGNQDTRIRAAFAWNNATQRHLFGCVSTDNTASITSYMNGAWRFGAKSATKSIAKSNNDLLYVADVSKTRIAITGSSTAISDVADFQTVGTLLLGGARDGDGSLPSVGFSGPVESFRIWSGDELVQHLIPITDGTAFRFWNTVSREFHDSITDVPLAGGYW